MIDLSNNIGLIIFQQFLSTLHQFSPLFSIHLTPLSLVFDLFDLWFFFLQNHGFDLIHFLLHAESPQPKFWCNSFLPPPSSEGFWMWTMGWQFLTWFGWFMNCWLNWLRGVCRGLPCYAASPEQLFSFWKRQPWVSLADITLLVGVHKSLSNFWFKRVTLEWAKL